MDHINISDLVTTTTSGMSANSGHDIIELDPETAQFTPNLLDMTDKTISIAIPTELIRGDVYHWGPLLAGALIVSIPIVVLYTFFIDQLVAGLTSVARR